MAEDKQDVDLIERLERMVEGFARHDKLGAHFLITETISAFRAFFLANGLSHLPTAMQNLVNKAFNEAWNTRPNTNAQKVHSDDVRDVDGLECAADKYAYGTKTESEGVASVTRRVIAFKAGYLSRGPVNAGWCFDMDKAPINESCEIAYQGDGVEPSTKITFQEDGICPKTGKDYGTGLNWNGVNEYFVTVYAWRLSLPPTPPTQAPKEP